MIMSGIFLCKIIQPIQELKRLWALMEDHGPSAHSHLMKNEQLRLNWDGGLRLIPNYHKI